MSFRVHPIPPIDGLVLRANATTPPIPFDDPTEPDDGQRTMFLRCCVFGSDCSPPLAHPPDILLIADDVEDQVTSVNGVDPTPVAGGRAFATVFPTVDGRGVFRVEIFVFAEDLIRWRLRFRNPAVNGPGALRLMWVVADSTADSRQPWISVRERTLLLDARPGEHVTGSIHLENHGTGLLTITDLPAAATPGLTIAEAPPPIPPNSCATLRLAFTGQADPASNLKTWTVPSNDTTAATEWDDDVDELPTHTGRLDLVLTSHPRMPILNSGDILVADSWRILRIDPSTGLQSVVVNEGLAVWLDDLAMEASGDLLFRAGNSLVRIDRRSGSVRVVSEGGALEGATGMLVAPDESILVVDSATGSVTRVDPHTGAQSEILSTPGWRGGAIALSAAGSLYMASWAPFEGVQTGTLVRITLSTGTVVPVLRKPGFSLEGVAVAPDGSVFVVANRFFHEEHQLIRVDPQSGAATTVFNRADFLLHGVIVPRSGDALVTGRVWPAPNPFVGPFGGELLRLSPADDGDAWPATRVSAGNLLSSPGGLTVVG